MNAVTINLLPKGSSIYSGPVIGDYITSIFKLQTQLPIHSIQKGVVLGFVLDDSPFRVMLEEIEYSTSSKETILKCSYCSYDLADIGMFKKKSFFEKLSNSLLSNGWTVSEEKY